MPMRIDRSDEELIRVAERNVNRLWRTWSERFGDRSSAEVMGMVAFRFAQLYFTQQEAATGMDEMLGNLADELDRCLEATQE